MEGLTLDEFRIDLRAKRCNKKRPDIICYHNGLLVPLDLSYDKINVECGAKDRTRRRLADLVIAVWLKHLFRNVTEYAYFCIRLYENPVGILESPS